MSRIDIEGVIPLISESYLRGDQQQRLGNEQRKKQFARYLSPRSLPIQDMAHGMTSAGGNDLTQTDYHIVSGPLCGTRVRVSLSIHGLNIVLSHANRELIERLQRIQVRWQRQLCQLGFPCLLEVTHAGESDG
jgi:hypothetical protein